ncbi:DUF4956 domain-containing protein [Marinilactibacillus piezotolerans]|uniref:DUF4956 domain-containing protein n=1 Tax=Marinilactibacillus piezotolerans TaxID=258723 RepID=UPI0009AFEB7E|nr:DUF4956 domain-containing protein [Marinilactibacillus piezotolerans]
MYQLQNILDGISPGFENEEITTTTILTMLLMVSIFSFYEFLVYRYVSKRSFYSKHFNISLAIIPFFIASIIMSLQSSLVVTLGTIGALAIIRFRTAVKDPLDMVYLFWSVHTGIVVGTGLYEVAFLTSVVVTVFILLLDFMPLGKAPYLLVLNIKDIEEEDTVLALVNQYARNVNVKSRNFSSNGIDMIAEVRTKEEAKLMQEIVNLDSVKAASLVAHDGEKEF